MFSLLPYIPQNPDHHKITAAIWTSACGSDFAISPSFIAFNTHPTKGIAQAGRIALLENRPVGFVLASATIDESAIPEGWIDAIAVAPSAQRLGVGSALLEWASTWFRNGEERRAYPIDRAQLGASPRTFTPGLPVSLNSERFFLEHGFQQDKDTPFVWDVAHCLSQYAPQKTNFPTNGELLPLQTGQEDDLRIFLAREFPDRWYFDYLESIRTGDRLPDYLLLWVGGKVQGFCQVTLEDSPRPLERYYPHRLPRPWGQLGSIGISAEMRGKGYGGFIIDAAIRRLRSLGVDGCVIDWTNLLDLYGKFGFKPYTKYTSLTKELA